MIDSRTVAVGTFATELEAELAVARLEAEGVPCTLLSDGGGVLPMLQATRGVKLLVASNHETKAREILGSSQELAEDSEFVDDRSDSEGDERPG